MRREGTISEIALGLCPNFPPSASAWEGLPVRNTKTIASHLRILHCANPCSAKFTSTIHPSSRRAIVRTDLSLSVKHGPYTAARSHPALGQLSPPSLPPIPAVAGRSLSPVNRGGCPKGFPLFPPSVETPTAAAARSLSTSTAAAAERLLRSLDPYHHGPAVLPCLPPSLYPHPASTAHKSLVSRDKVALNVGGSERGSDALTVGWAFANFSLRPKM